MEFNKTTGNFMSSDGKNTIAYYCYEPVAASPQAVLQLSHGMCEYIERYEEFAEFLCKNGVVLCGNDHLGHGSSVSSDEELGFIAEKEGVNLLVNDLYKMTTLMKHRFSGVPYFLMGHSMGSFVARAYLTWYARELTGAIICGTSGGNPASVAGIALANRLAASKGDHHRSKVLNNMAFGGYNKRFSGKTGSEWLTRDPEVVAQYVENPKCNFIFTAAGFRDLFTLLQFVSSKDWYDSMLPEIPIFLIAGGDDPVGDYGKGVRKVAGRLIECGVNDVSMKLYPEARHELTNEVNRKDVFQDILAWIWGRLPL